MLSRVVSGEALWRGLGYDSLRTFQRARQHGEKLPPLYPILGRPHGVYALREELDRFVALHGKEKPNRRRRREKP